LNCGPETGIGCGTGLNVPYLRAAVGDTGHVYGVDLSAGMLARARSLVDSHQWRNVTLVQDDAVDYRAPEPLDGVLFGFSYSTMPHHHVVLLQALAQLRPGGRVCVMDATLPPGRWGRVILPLSVWLMKHTLLGNPYIHPWDHVAPATVDFQIRHFLFSAYYVCRGTKRTDTRQSSVLEGAFVQSEAAEVGGKAGYPWTEAGRRRRANSHSAQNQIAIFRPLALGGCRVLGRRRSSLASLAANAQAQASRTSSGFAPVPVR
jgi:SAM-dependent methyltransferase